MIPLRLEAFERDEEPVVVTHPSALEEIRRIAREEGRAEALAEAALAADTAERALAEDVSRSLQEMAFAWHGARDQMLEALDPLLRSVLHTVLPPMAAAALAPQVAEAVLPLARQVTGADVRLVLHPDDRAAIEPRLPPAAFPLTIATDVAIPRGTARLLSAGAETRVDPVAASDAILAALDDFFTLCREVRHG